jgi:hypothetical protein
MLHHELQRGIAWVIITTFVRGVAVGTAPAGTAAINERPRTPSRRVIAVRNVADNEGL